MTAPKEPNAPIIHPTALVESEYIGSDTYIWAFAHVMAGAQIGHRCTVGDHTFIEGGVVVGNDVTIKNACLLFDGLSIGDAAFIGPGVRFTNDARPRSPRAPFAQHRYQTKEWMMPTHVGTGASIGAGAIILPGITIGEFAMVGAGAIVTRNVEPYTVVHGNPARRSGFTCACGAFVSTAPVDAANVSCVIDSVACDWCAVFNKKSSR